jgi:putative DNA primase/helicase
LATATELFNLGYTDLVSVIPPDAKLSPGSRIRPESRGKSPGVKNEAGLWVGYTWRLAPASSAVAERIDRDRANIGLRAGRFPAIDVDVRDEGLAEVISEFIEKFLPTGPMRVGAWPKRLYMFRLPDGEPPFRRMQVVLDPQKEKHVVEILGEGQQYVVGGIHPKTGKPYEWRVPLVPADQLPTLTREQAEALLDKIVERFDRIVECERVGGGRCASRANVNQDDLKAKDLGVLEEAVRAIPNTDLTFPSRADYIRFGYALRGATQDDPGRGLEMYQEWAAKWEGYNDPEDVARDWESFKGPFQLGADYIFQLAQQHGFNYAQYEFPALEAGPPPVPEGSPDPVRYSELWAAREFVDSHLDRLRWVPQWGSWVVWDGKHWKRDEMGTAYRWAQETALRIADRLARQGATEREQREATQRAKAVSSERYIRNMMLLARGDKRIVTPSDAFDADLWRLGTPDGSVDLHTGTRLAPDPKCLVSRVTNVSPVDGDCPRWEQFLREVTGGDENYISYLQRYLGYALTGETKEHRLHFAYGSGGNGKSVFLETVSWIMGDYAATAPMDSFTATRNERHPTDLAGLQAARLVTASETQQGRQWDEARVKSLTGGERIRARYMYQDFFEFVPQFKLLFAGNYRPEVRNLDDAMRRRIVLLPFTQKPVKVDPDLKDKLKREGGAILSWMIEGCQAWQRNGLGEPAKVKDATKEYFRDEDAIARWASERVVREEEGSALPKALRNTRSTALWDDWEDWCRHNREDPRTQKAFSMALKSRGWKSDRDAYGTVFTGVEILPVDTAEFALDAPAVARR